MAKRTPNIDERIARMRRSLGESDQRGAEELLADALADAHFRLVAFAAEECRARLCYGLQPRLVDAFRGFADRPAAHDPQCIAKSALARTLVALDYADVEFFLAGIRFRQLEPVWGGSQDTASDVRLNCAMGLAATAYARALPELATLLADPEPGVRAGVAAAIACAEPIAAEAVLRTKALAGDPEPDVTGACLVELLRLAPDESPAFVGAFLGDADPVIRQLAALALGESRLDASLAQLRSRWDAAVYKGADQQVLLRAAVLHRSEAAFDWLVSVIADGERRIVEPLIRELAIYSGNRRLRDQVRHALARRAEEALATLFDRHWGSEPDTD